MSILISLVPIVGPGLPAKHDFSSCPNDPYQCSCAKSVIYFSAYPDGARYSRALSASVALSIGKMKIVEKNCITSISVLRTSFSPSIESKKGLNDAVDSAAKREPFAPARSRTQDGWPWLPGRLAQHQQGEVTRDGDGIINLLANRHKDTINR